MSYDEFLDELKRQGWEVPNRSFAHRTFSGKWQVSFIRMGGRFQEPGYITFVICVRHVSLRNLEGKINAEEKEPHAYPYKLTLPEAEAAPVEYKSRLLNYEMSRLEHAQGWAAVYRALEITVPAWLNAHTADELKQELARNGEDGYIEKIWLEDLSDG